MKVILIILILGGGIAWANFAHIGYSFRGPGYDPKSGVTAKLDGGRVIVAVTDGEISSGKRKAFFKELKGVLDRIPTSEGLVGYAVRKELFGNKVWTLSAWTNRDSLKRFVRSEAHRRAVKKGGILPETVHSVTLELPPNELPIPWKRVQEMLETNRES